MSSAPRILSVDEMPRVRGLRVPKDFYVVLETPARLAGMAYPRPGTPWHALADLGLRHIVCLTHRVAPYDPSPLSLLCAVDLQDLCGGVAPLCPDEERRKIEAAISSILAALGRGEGVVVHCEGGTGRTGTVLAAVLTDLGNGLPDVVGALGGIHHARGTSWPESPWQREFLERRCARSAATAKA
jgi:hypothetical protein